ncbi:hypothetical protein WISP_28330 [Willisornis vidua]|uniref:CCHC-type domain-containing protein n=1 Tax=Willisornis vidua TaxID=1566151 RepID=A0ABQ9DLK2_9PASS|nr:hypothetical protein WISP_28330 [Willisornis vidua]
MDGSAGKVMDFTGLQAIQAFHVYYDDNQARTWEPLPVPLITDAKKAITEYGLSSAYAMGIVRSMFQAFIFTPNDLKDLAWTLVNDMEITMFLDQWLANIWKYAHETIASTQQPVQETINMLYGLGDYAFNATQMTIPTEHLITTKNLAFSALQTVAEASQVTPPFQSVFQGPEEPFMHFAERLKQAIARETKDKTVQDILFKQLAISSASAQCQPVLRALKDPTPLEMVKACKDITQTDKLANTLADAQKSVGNSIGSHFANSNKQLVKDIAKEITQALAAAANPINIKCFNCGEPGHFKNNCPKARAPKLVPPGLCPKCRKCRLWATECRSQFDRQGRPLTPAPARKGSPPRNSSQSAAGGAMTQNAFPLETGGAHLLLTIPEGEPSQVRVSWGWQLPSHKL